MRHLRTAPSFLDTDRSDELAESPGTALYEHAAGLLAVAGGLQAAAHEPGAPAAMSATLACLEASLEALAGAVVQLGVGASEQLGDEDLPRLDTSVAGAEVTQRFRSVADALQRARVECTHARAAVSPVRCCARHTAWEAL